MLTHNTEIEDSHGSDVEAKFWNSFKGSLQQNKKGFEGKTRILSIIADNFTYSELSTHLNV